MKVILVHGFADFNGVATTDLFRPFFESRGLTVIEFDYGFTGFFGVRLLNDKRASQLAEIVQPGDIGLGHSNGCAILAGACRAGAMFDKLVFINPALDEDATISAQVRQIDVWHSPGDLPVRFANLFYKHPWGRMGAVGYKGDDKRFRNFNKQEDFEKHSYTHLDVFLPHNMKYFGPVIADKALEG